MKRAAWARTVCVVLGIGFCVFRLDGADFGSRALAPALHGKAGFTLIPSTFSGVSFTNRLEGDAFLTNAVAHNGSGLAIGDVDGDGLPDIYFCNLQGANDLYRNRGDWRFEKVEVGPAACADQYSTGAVLADIDGDADLDLLVNGIAAGTRLFLNDGKRGWMEKIDSGLSRTNSATSMALADIDGDGDLDLYCAHYIDVMHLADPTTRFAMGRREGKWEVTRVNGESTRAPKWKDRFEALPDGSVRELPEIHALYRNLGDGKFMAIQREPGVFLDESGQPIPPFRDWGLAVMFRDFNGDGAPDFYVCNDNASPDRFWINTGNGTFRAAAKSVLRHTSRSSMGIDFADLDRDGRDDFIVVDMLAREHGKRLTQLAKDYPTRAEIENPVEQPRFNRNTLFFGRSDGSFAEGAFLAGVAATDWSWCPIFLDVDLDGYEDLLVSNGFSFDVMDQDSHDALRGRKLTPEEAKRQRQFHPRWPTKMAAFRNRRDGTFERADAPWGFGQERISYGMALGDLDGDGDLDLVVNHLNETQGLYRNDTTAPRIAVRLQGLGQNRQGVGARIRLTGATLTQSQEMISGGRYMSGDQALRVFAADGEAMRLEVRWRNGGETILTNVQANRLYEIQQTSGTAKPVPQPGQPNPTFHDASHLLNHTHRESNYDDWARQSTVPRRLSRLGPGVNWFDFNGDGWEDLSVSAGQEGKAAMFLSDRGKSFRKQDGPTSLAGDQNAVLGWADGAGNRKLLFSISNFERPISTNSALAVCSPETSTTSIVPLGNASAGPIASADIDGDGDLDIFVGGRVIPGRYPEPASSWILRNDAGELKRNDPLSAPFESVGMVSGATFADWDGDDDPDLALAIEWGPVRIFRNTVGRFEEATVEWGLAKETGWWTSVTAGDFNGDGQLDLAAGNWGRNSEYELHGPSPLRAYYGDWNNDGTIELLEAWRQDDRWFPVRHRTWLARAFPELPQRFPTHAAFAQATIPEILGPRYEQARHVEASQLESSIFLNRGAQFERVPLPREAQLSPIFSLNVGDFDSDGIEDLFASQNFFGAASDLSREDAGFGLWLRGKGNGTFSPLDPSESGVEIPGEQRGAALVDFDHDGRVDLAVSQNNGATKLYLNQHPRRGLRITFKGPPSNPDAVGARLRLQYGGGRQGPVRSVQAGSAPVLGLAENAESLWIRWPGGKEQVIPLENQNEVHVQVSE